MLSRVVRLKTHNTVQHDRVCRWAYAVAALSSLLIGLLLTIPAHAQSLAHNATAEHIRSIHKDSPKKAWQLIYRAEDQSEIKFVIWQDYAKITMNGSSKIYDYNWKRLIQLSDDEARFFHLSLFMDVGFRDFEFQNRRRLSQTLERIGETSANGRTVLDPFWRASDLGHMRGPMGLLGAEQHDRIGGGFSVSYEGVTAVDFQPAAQKLNVRHHETLYRTLRYILQVHPFAQKLMAESGHPPSILKFKNWNTGQSAKPGQSITSAETVEQLRERIWSLRSVEQLNLDYPLRQDSRPDFQLLIDEAGLTPAFKTHILPSVRTVLGDKSPSGRPIWENRRTLAQNLISSGNSFDAGLMVMEYEIQYRACQQSQRPCSEIQELLRTAASDQRFREYSSAFSIERSNRDQAIAIWSGLDRKGLRFGYVVDIALGNALQPIYFDRTNGGRPQDIVRIRDQILGHFKAALEGNPLNSSIYKDLGDFYFKQFRPTEAWLLWDLGRDLDAILGSRNNLKFVDKFESRLETNFPEYFL